ncbi:AI-2E family transporter [Paucibacter sp. M5-1]|uniref:AI-2E family transporter n=1 Tax=Paucibacter sp. M5-1 TaxID=3015998 RepID=UPI0010F9E162|nr:AI-2E family transporter [Paucibacter sp. M5-1]MCZ7879742.1 AI-2E family transporter [Paucibacter sp. M5-1]
MPSLPPDDAPALHDKTFVLLLVLVTLAFGWILLPFYGAVLWGTAMAIVFAPLYRRLLKPAKGRRTLAALGAIFIVLLLVILPLALITLSLVQEGTALYAKSKSGEFNFTTYVQQIYAALPAWLTQLLDRFGLGNLNLLQDKLVSALNQGSQLLASKALGFGQDTFDFVVSFFIMLYLMFFVMRDGEQLSRRIREALPLRATYKRMLGEKFTTVIRATVKGNIAVAALQGALGGLAFWVLDVHAPVLWAVLMAFLSLLPAVGAGLVWLPVALYFLATGNIAAGLGLIAYGVLVIGLVDNLLRPLLVGKDTKMPDYIVLISTLGGMAVFGLNGFVIGPLIAAMFMAVWDIVATERRGLHN